MLTQRASLFIGRSCGRCREDPPELLTSSKPSQMLKIITAYRILFHGFADISHSYFGMRENANEETAEEEKTKEKKENRSHSKHRWRQAPPTRGEGKILYWRRVFRFFWPTNAFLAAVIRQSDARWLLPRELRGPPLGRVSLDLITHQRMFR